MPRSPKCPQQWYARARAYTEMAEAIPEPQRGVNPWEDPVLFEERRGAHELVRRQLKAEAKRCWLRGGKLEVERMKAQPENPRGPDVRGEPSED